MLIVALVIANLVANVRAQTRVAGARERRTSLLYAMSRELAATRGFDNSRAASPSSMSPRRSRHARPCCCAGRHRAPASSARAGADPERSEAPICRSPNGYSTTAGRPGSAPTPCRPPRAVSCRSTGTQQHAGRARGPANSAAPPAAARAAPSCSRPSPARSPSRSSAPSAPRRPRPRASRWRPRACATRCSPRSRTICARRWR